MNKIETSKGINKIYIPNFSLGKTKNILFSLGLKLE